MLKLSYLCYKNILSYSPVLSVGAEPVKNTVVSKELNARCDIGGEIVNKHKKRMWPNTVPWGTPETTGDYEEAELLTTTRRLHPVRKLWSQMLAFLQIL